MSKSKITDAPDFVPEEEVVEVEPVSEYNCAVCEGKGLIGDPASIKSHICNACAGTGKTQ